jgi:uncharacterized Zn finger protein
VIIDSKIFDELKMSSNEHRIARADEIYKSKKVTITKVVYNDKKNFSVHAVVNGGNGNYDTYISAKNGELDDVRCTCADYESTYGTCKHILATAMCFNETQMYDKLFNEEKKTNKSTSKPNDEKYRIYRQMINSFYEEEQKKEKSKITKIFYSGKKCKTK